MSKAMRISAALAVILLAGISLSSAQKVRQDAELEKSDDGKELIARDVVEDIPLGELIQLYSEYSGRSVMYDAKRIQGTISIAAPSDGLKLDAKNTLLSALAEFRLTLVSDGTFDKIVPAAEAPTMCDTITPSELKDRRPGEFVRIVYPLKSVDANQARGVLQNLTTRQGGVVSPVGGMNGLSNVNALIIADYVENIETLIRCIEELESQALIESRVIELEHVNYKDINDAVRAGETEGIRVGCTDDLKTVVVTGSAAGIERLAGLIKQLDKAKEE